MPTDSFSPTGTVGPTWDEDSGVGHLSQAGLMVMLRLFFSLVNFNKSAYWIKEQPVRRGDRVKLWEKQRPLDSLRELLLALNSLPKLGLSQQFMTSWDLVSALLVLYFGMRLFLAMEQCLNWISLVPRKDPISPFRSQYGMETTRLASSINLFIYCPAEK